MTIDQQQNQLIKPTYKLDRLSLVYSEPNTEFAQKTAGMMLGDHINKSIPGMTVTANARYKVSCRIPLPFKSGGSKHVVVFEAGPQKPTTPSYRLDFNPAKLPPAGLDDLMVLLESIVDVDALVLFAMSRVTRCDIALDLHGLSLADVIVRSSGLQKHGVYSNRHGNPETVYLGTPKSRRVVAYDKPATELPVTHYLRLECRLKPRCLGHQLAQLSNPFEKVELIPASFSTGLDLGIPAQYIADSIRIGGLKRALAPLDKKQSKALKKAYAEAHSLLPDLAATWTLWPNTLIGYGLGKELGAIPVKLIQAA